MKQSLQEIVEKNTTLELENQRLREHIRELNQWLKRPRQESVKQRIVQIANEFGKDIRRRIPCFVMTYMDLEENMMNRVLFVLK